MRRLRPAHRRSPARRALHCGPPGDRPPQAWTISTDLGTRHHGGGGGGGTPGTDRLLAWHTTIAPAPPERASRIDVLAKAPGASKPTRSHPDHVIGLGAEPGLLFGSQLVIPTLTVWPTWFDLSIVGTGDGAWADGLRALKRAGRWTAHDNHGHRYLGACTGGSSGLGLSRKDLSFTPALAPEATTLTITFPASYDGHAHHTTVTLGER